MRVIAGSLKGRRLSSPTWKGLRPTSDKLRETIFNILAPRIVGARVVDLYAGTGALGIEALSRGAARVVFVERERRARALIEENLARCGVSEGYAIIRASALDALNELTRAGTGQAFDIVLLDPPYDEFPEPVVAAAGKVVAEGGVVVLEHARRRPAPSAAGRLTRVRDIGSGESALAIYEVNRCRPLPCIPVRSTP